MQKLEVQDRWEVLQRNNSVIEAMQLRCTEQGHEYENGLDAMFHFLRICKWCGHRKY